MVRFGTFFMLYFYVDLFVVIKNKFRLHQKLPTV